MTDVHNMKKIIQNMVQKLVTEYAPQKVILFGSYSYGSPDSDSDIDFFIIKETSERFIDRWTTVLRILTGMHPSIPVEVFVLTPQEVENRLAVGDQFIEEIMEKGKILYNNKVHPKILEICIYTVGGIPLPIFALCFQFETMNLYCR